MAAQDTAQIVGAAAGASGLDWFRAASPIISGVLSDKPASATSSAYQNVDGSGWQVTTGSGSNSASSNYVIYAVIVAAAIVAIKLFKK